VVRVRSLKVWFSDRLVWFGLVWFGLVWMSGLEVRARGLEVRRLG
jgi:hypothetical protein